MIAEGKDSSIELLHDQVIVRRFGKVTADVPISDVSETRYRQATPFSEGHLQIRARITSIDGLDGTARSTFKSQVAFEKLNREINKRIAVSRALALNNAPKPDTMNIMLSSGNWIPVTRVKLYPEARVADIHTLRMQASKALGPSSSSVGVFGAPGVAFVAEAAALSFVSGLLANAAAKQAIETIKKAQELYESMTANDGLYVGVVHIAKIELPLPNLWRALKDNGDAYVHSGDDFISVDSSSGQFLINWRDVSAIQFSSGAETAYAEASAIQP